MNFKTDRFFKSLLISLLGLFLLYLGCLSLGLSWSPSLQEAAIVFLTDSYRVVIVGVGLIFLGLLCLLYAWLAAKRRYAFIKTGPFSVAVDEELLHQSLESYWKEHFPYLIPFTLHIKKKAISIIAHFPTLPEEEQQIILKKVSDDFEKLFARTLGIPHEIQFFANFQTT
ncbi:MAG: hypothetical protein LW832_02555 [Parachlamydia sp.]|jgi:hypothetical protein|nr:hypothetical protein [Parachlamydia sp.]